MDDRNARFIKFLQDVGVIDPTMPDPLADITGVQLFGTAMMIRLNGKRAEGRHGWHQPDVCSMVELKLMLGASITHPNEDIDKNLLDIANFCMMIWNRRQYEETLPLQEVRPGLDEGV